MRSYVFLLLVACKPPVAAPADQPPSGTIWGLPFVAASAIAVPAETGGYMVWLFDTAATCADVAHDLPPVQRWVDVPLDARGRAALTDVMFHRFKPDGSVEALPALSGEVAATVGEASVHLAVHATGAANNAVAGTLDAKLCPRP